MADMTQLPQPYGYIVQGHFFGTERTAKQYARCASVSYEPLPITPVYADYQVRELVRNAEGSPVIPAEVEKEARPELVALIDRLDGYLTSPEQVALRDELRAALDSNLPSREGKK